MCRTWVCRWRIATKVFEEIERLKAAGLGTFTETDTDCCHAIQDKVWVADPRRGIAGRSSLSRGMSKLNRHQ